MLQDHAKLMKVFSYAGEIVGRKKLQKMIYIAKKLHFPFNEKYDFHFFGPYSEELTLRVEELGNNGFLHEEKEKKGGYVQYRYTLSKAGEEFLRHFQIEMPHLEDCIKNMNEQSSRFLELVSTVLYFEDLPKEQVRDKVFTLKSKQRYTNEEIENAYQYIDTLREQIFEKARSL
ncbi:YwgA family protein [Calidifontibacillus erzurumensis]|uniref:YwgA family protein n=1 Tax=Calidifontibacillus erzurumensis TaxID=2741433 RepID=A0A8J8GIH6_9BACI|nr:YwgA family protein [Calidifontibacillus erzurumensis]NSL52983.1 YwgA family protein [Calidifontibacillus erzurumensis]